MAKLRELSFKIPHQENERFHPDAASSIVGDRILFQDKPAQITDARVENGDLLVSVEILEPAS